MPRFTTLQDELYINGAALSTMPGIIVQDYPFHATGNRRGDNSTTPGRRGQYGVAKPLDAYTFSIPVTVMGDNTNGTIPTSLHVQRANMLHNLQNLAAQMSTAGGIVTLMRRIQTGESTSVLQSAEGEFVAGLGVNLLVPETGQTELQFINLDGCWLDVDYTTVAPGTITVPGAFSTRSIELTLPGAGTLTNVTANVWVSVTTACVLTVDTYNATAGMATIRHDGDNEWFVLYPGSNNVTWTGSGTPTIKYKAAWS